MQGSCLCEKIRFSVQGEPQEASCCHCSQCRKMSGHYWASAQVPRNALTITGDCAWYAASDIARRGFCPGCGAFLFWDGHADDTISFALGALEGPTGLRLTKHIFVADKGDYYDIADGLPQEAQ